MQTPTVPPFWHLPLEACLTILAILVGPIAALLIQRKLDGWKADKERKIMIFRTLMAYRARSTRLSPQFVQALNGIETEFYGKTKVVEKWRSLVDHAYKQFEPKDEKLWGTEFDKRTVELLVEMAKDLGFHFDTVTLERNVYSPQLWADVELEQTRLRKAAIRVFEGEAPLKIKSDGQ